MNGVIIQARMGSNRFPGKVMKEIMGKPILYYVYKRSAHAKYSDRIVIATTRKKEDDTIVHWCLENNIHVFRGLECDLINRYYQAAKEFDIENIARVTADNPFVMSEILDLAFLLRGLYKNDFVAPSLSGRNLPFGLGTMCFTRDMIERANNESTSHQEREHVLPYFKKRLHIINAFEIPYPFNHKEIRLSIDYEKDYEVLKPLMEELIKKHGLYFNMSQLMAMIG